MRLPLLLGLIGCIREKISVVVDSHEGMTTESVAWIAHEALLVGGSEEYADIGGGEIYHVSARQELFPNGIKKSFCINGSMLGNVKVCETVNVMENAYADVSPLGDVLIADKPRKTIHLIAHYGPK